MQNSFFFVLFLGVISFSEAHIALTWPPPLRASYNPAAVAAGAIIDYTPTAPLAADGSNFPFKGYEVDIGKPAGASVANFKAGAAGNVTTGTGASHGGGSCQISLSYDKGTSFTVIHSFIGSCPITMPQTFDFTIPSDAPTGAAVLSWSWQNLIGNREFYLSPASVTIEAADSSAARPAVAWASRPGLFVVNLANGCTSTEGEEVVYPDPGPDADITIKKTTSGSGSGFTGTCAAVKGVGGGSSSSSSTNSASDTSAAVSSATTPVSSAVVSSSPVSATQTGGIFVTVPVSATSAAQSSAASPSSLATPTALSTTPDGQCSGAHTCNGSIHGPCCSKWGWCGSTDDYCGAGCQSGFGNCGNSAASASASLPSSEPTSASNNISSTTGTEASIVTSPIAIATSTEVDATVTMTIATITAAAVAESSTNTEGFVGVTVATSSSSSVSQQQQRRGFVTMVR